MCLPRKGGVQIQTIVRRLSGNTGGNVRYQKAEDILPAELLAEIQKYVDGVYLYIPRRADRRQSWGNSTRYREELRQRDESIRYLHREGLSVTELAERFHLSEKSIWRILRQK